MSESASMTVFDRRAVRRNRDRAAPRFDDFAFLAEEVTDRLLDRLEDVRRTFPTALDLGCRTGGIARRLAGRGGIETLIQTDLSPAMAARAGALAVAADEETLPFAEESFDLILSCLSLHWVNDLPGALVQVRRALKPDGLFLAALFGGGTLAELRDALAQAEIETRGGMSPRVSPFAEVKDLGNLLARAGFALPVADADTIAVSYADPLRLMADLRGMGEANAMIERPREFARRDLIAAAGRTYIERHAGPDGRIPATFGVVYLLGWAPHPDQPKAVPRGSAAVSMTEALK